MPKTHETDAVLDSIRVSHCAQTVKTGHPCVGSCKITPSGIELECTVCGDGTESIRNTLEYSKLAKILSYAGIQAAYLDDYTVKSMLEELKK